MGVSEKDLARVVEHPKEFPLLVCLANIQLHFHHHAVVASYIRMLRCIPRQAVPNRVHSHRDLLHVVPILLLHVIVRHDPDYLVHLLHHLHSHMLPILIHFHPYHPVLQLLIPQYCHHHHHHHSHDYPSYVHPIAHRILLRSIHHDVPALTIDVVMLVPR